MEANYLEVGDLVKVTNFDGATGHLIKARYGTASTFEVVEIKSDDLHRIGKNLASIKPPGSSDAPIKAHWERLEKIGSGVRTLPEPDMDLDEIHRAQALMEG